MWSTEGKPPPHAGPPEVLDASTKELEDPRLDASAKSGPRRLESATESSVDGKETLDVVRAPAFAPDAERGIGESLFYRFGRGMGARPFIALLAVAALFIALIPGLFVSSRTDTDLFGSLILRPGTRLNRESKKTDWHLVEGYETQSEATNARSTKGSSNVLTRKHIVQMANFYRHKDVLDINYNRDGVRYSSLDMLRSTGPQPLRFTTLDCFQEGSYDFYAPSLVAISERLAPLVQLTDAMLAPFGPPHRLTPYDLCLYARLDVVYTPSTSVNPREPFGDCRQFVDADTATEDHATLGVAYDFHVGYAVDFLKSSPSLYLTWACKAPFAAEPAGRCHPTYTCCQISQIYGACAMCETLGDAACSQLDSPPFSFSNAICEAQYAVLLQNDDDWQVNPDFDPTYPIATAPCSAYGFYPVSSLYGSAIQAPPSYPSKDNLGLEDCPARAAALEPFQADPVLAEPLIKNFMQSIICTFSGANPAGNSCPKLIDRDYAWQLLGPNLATENEVFETAAQIHKPCYMWDGGGALPSVSLELTLGNIRNKGTKALQVVYASNGYDTVKDNLKAKGISVSSHAARHGRIDWLRKFSKRLKGRYKGGAMLFGTYTSTAVEETVKDATVPELWLICLGYALILAYALGVFAARTPGGAKHKLKAVALALAGIACVFFGAAAGVGLGCYAGLKFNALSVQVLPFLLLGLGINDLFVVFYRYVDVIRSDELDKSASDYASQVVAGVVATAGYTVTITSFSNIVVFIIAETIEMRIMAQFAHLAAAGLAGTYVGVFFGFHALLALHAPTFKESAASFAEEKEEAEGEKAASVYPDDPDKVAPRGGCDAGLRAYAHGVTSKPVKYACMLLGLAAVLVLGIVGIPRLDMGMPLYAIFKDGSSPKIFWRTKDAHLPTQFIYVVTEKSDWPTKHPLLAGAPPPAPQYYNLFGQVEGGKNMIKPLPTPPWYSVYLQWLLPCSWSSFDDPEAENWSKEDVAAACATSPWYSKIAGPAPAGAAFFNPRCQLSDSSGGACGPRVSRAFLNETEFLYADAKQKMYDGGTSGLSAGTVPACTAWPVQLYACDGKPCFEDAFPANLWRDIKDRKTVVLGVHPTYFYECLNLFQNNDQLHDMTSPSWNCEEADDPSRKTACAAVPRNATSVARKIWRGKDGAGQMDFTRSRVWAKDLKTGADWVDTIDSIRHRMNKFVRRTDVEAYPTGRLWKFYSQYRWLPQKMAAGMGYSLLAIFAIMFGFFFAGVPASRGPAPARAARAAWTVFLVCVAIAITIVLFVALMGLAELLLNCFTAVTVIMALGISVEFLAHTAYEHLRCEGTREERAFHATWTYVGPIVDGAITSFLGFLALAFSYYEYIQLYYFQLYSIILACGLVVGIVLFPAMLATVGAE